MQTSRFKRPSSGPKSGFTLVEMITVIGIIALLVALVTPALVDVIRSTRLGSAGDSLVNRISLAQQSAVSLNTEVELRFYKYIDENSDRPSDTAYYAYQVVSTPPSGEAQPISDVYYLESGVILSSLQSLSPLLTASVQQRPNASGNFLFTPTTKGIQPDAVTYAALRFYTDGSCRVLSENDAGTTAAESATAFTIPPLTESFLTVIESRDAEAGLPKNFYCVQIDTYTGKTRVYRP
jgi:uncharacterized protein (TIGR02596 family)